MERESIIPPEREDSYTEWHYSPAVVSGDFVFVSGCMGTLPDGNVSDVPGEQIRRAFENVDRILSLAGVGFDDVVEMTTYHVGLMAHLELFRQIKDEFVGEPYPAWTAIGISELVVPGALSRSA